MSSNISDLGQQVYLRGLISKIKSDALTMQNQVTSGKRASVFNELGGVDALQSLSLRADRNKVNAYNNSIAVVKSRLGVMDATLSELSDNASTLVSQISIPAQYTGKDPGMVSYNQIAKKDLEALIDRLNVNYQGQRLFAGSDVVNPPLDPASVQTAIQNELNAMYTGQGAATTLTNINTLGSTTATNADLGFNATIGNAKPATAVVDDGVTVDYTVRADDDAFKGLIRGLTIMANLRFPQPGDTHTEADFWDTYNAARAMIDKGGRDVTLLQGKVGVVQAGVEVTQTKHSNTIDALDSYISNTEDVDPAQALAKLNSLQAQLEASYRVMAQLRDLSLVNYL